MAWLRTVTVTPGSAAAWASTTCPLNSLVPCCAAAVDAAANSHANAKPMRRTFIVSSRTCLPRHLVGWPAPLATPSIPAQTAQFSNPDRTCPASWMYPVASLDFFGNSRSGEIPAGGIHAVYQVARGARDPRRASARSRRPPARLVASGIEVGARRAASGDRIADSG